MNFVFLAIYVQWLWSWFILNWNRSVLHKLELWSKWWKVWVRRDRRLVVLWSYQWFFEKKFCSAKVVCQMIPDNDMANNIMRWMKTKLNGCKQFSGRNIFSDHFQAGDLVENWFISMNLLNRNHYGWLRFIALRYLWTLEGCWDSLMIYGLAQMIFSSTESMPEK